MNVCSTALVTYDLRNPLRQRHRRPHAHTLTHTYRAIMWVTTYIAQLSATKAEVYRK